MTVLTREQRIAWMAWHEFVHRGADYYRQVWGGKEWQTTLSKLRQNSALRHLAEAIQAERNAAYLNSGQDVRVTPEQAMEEALAELSAAIEQGNADALIARYGRFAPTTGRTRLQALLGKMADVIRRVLGRITKRQITQEELSDADAIGLLRDITALQGADDLADARASAGVAARQTPPAQAAERAVQRQERMPPVDAAAYSTAPSAGSGFYSALAREINTVQMKNGTAQAWKEQLAGMVSKGKVKEDEIFWTGIREWLDAQDGKISREAVQDYLRGGQVVIEEEGLRQKWSFRSTSEDERVYDSEEEAWDAYNEEENWIDDEAAGVNEDDGELTFWNANGDTYTVTREETEVWQDEYGDTVEPETAVNEEWGEYYEQDDDGNITVYDADGDERATYTTGTAEQWVGEDGQTFGSREDALEELERRAEEEKDYYRSVLREPELTERAEGSTVYRDYSFAGKGQNYRELLLTTDGGKVEQYQSPHWDNNENVLAHIRLTDFDGGQTLFVEELQSDWAQDRRKGKTDAAAPFVDKTGKWVDLTLKRVLMEAVNGGYQRVAFINGQQSADRYGLETKIASIEYDGKHLTAHPKGNGAPIEHEAAPQELDDIIGEETARKLLAQKETDGVRRLEGDELKMGGEGMKAFYDSVVPKALKALLRKADKGIRLENAMQEETGAEQLSFTVTDTMRETLGGGMPLFSVAPNLDEAADSAFARAVDRVAAGENIAGFVRLGTTPEALQLAGLPDTGMFIAGRVIKKVMNRRLGLDYGHNLDAETLKRLPEQLNRPIAIVKSSPNSTNPNSYIALTGLIETDFIDGTQMPVIATLALNVTKRGVELIDVTSVYGREAFKIENDLKRKVFYWDKEKGLQFKNAFRLQLPSQLRSDANLSRANIKTNEDLTQEKQTLQQEFAATAQQYGGEAAYKQAKAAGQTELDYRQWVQVRTPSFKAWFGDWQNDPKNASKVVNPRTGEPQVVYHGTNAQFDTFDTPLNMPRIFLTRSRAFAQKYGRDAMPLFVNARNTLNVDYAGRGAFDEIEVNGATLYDIEELADHAWENGYDGVLADNVVDSGTRDAKQSINDEVIVTDPAQIKSATGNGGAFNPADANIYHSTAPETGDQTPDARQQRTLRLASNRILNIARAIWDGAKNIGGEPIDFGTTPPVYQALGAYALPLRIVDTRKLFSLLRPKSEQGQRGDNTHELTPELLAQIPQALQKPVMVFDTEKGGGFVAVTELTDSDGAPVVAAIHLNHKMRYYMVNKVASIYGKNNAEHAFAKWTKEGRLRYVDTTSPPLLTSNGVQYTHEKSARDYGYTVLTDADVVKLQQQAAQTEAETKTGQALFSTAWHGTPYRGIENEGFDLGRIGTGEGAQAYGWGIYFAGDRDVSEEYRRRLSNSEEIVNFRFGDEPFIRTNDGWRSDEHGWQLEGAEEVAANAITDGTDLAALIAEAEEDEMDVIWDGHMEVDLDTAREAAQMIANGDIEADTRQGQLYSAEIPEDEELLDWDDAYSKQPQDVQEKIRRTLENAPQRALEDYGVASGQELADKILGDDPTGSNIYNSLDDIYGSDREASLALNDNGIPGLRYLDGNSRRAGEGSHNFVIWDDALLTPEAAQIEAMYSIPPQLVSDPPTQEGLAKRIMQAFTDPTIRDLWFVTGRANSTASCAPTRARKPCATPSKCTTRGCSTSSKACRRP